MIKISITLFFTLLLCMGCSHSQIPNAKTYPKSEQQFMQAAHHWNELARQEAGKILSSIPEGEPVYLKPACETNSFEQACETNPFEQAFYSLLTSRLNSKNIQILTEPENNTINILYNIQIIVHNRQGAATISWTELCDAFLCKNMTEKKVEVLITTQCIKNNKIIMSDSQIYYIFPENADNYMAKKPEIVLFKTTNIE